jgi:hypothetical protein
VWSSTINEIHQAYVGWGVANGRAARSSDMMSKERYEALKADLTQRGLLK